MWLIWLSSKWSLKRVAVRVHSITIFDHSLVVLVDVGLNTVPRRAAVIPTATSRITGAIRYGMNFGD